MGSAGARFLQADAQSPSWQCRSTEQNHKTNSFNRP